jgi:hypothetical protein
LRDDVVNSRALARPGRTLDFFQRVFQRANRRALREVRADAADGFLFREKNAFFFVFFFRRVLF